MNTKPENKIELPANLPRCACFTEGDEAFTWSRSGSMAKAAHDMCSAFHAQVSKHELCPEAMRYVLDLSIISVLAYVARGYGPALEYGSQEMEWETERLLSGLEARVLARNREAYRRAREMNLTEETVRAMRERDQKGEQS